MERRYIKTSLAAPFPLAPNPSLLYPSPRLLLLQNPSSPGDSWICLPIGPESWIWPSWPTGTKSQARGGSRGYACHLAVGVGEDRNLTLQILSNLQRHTPWKGVGFCLYVHPSGRQVLGKTWPPHRPNVPPPTRSVFLISLIIFPFQGHQFPTHWE